ncbi:hypothetical protein [Nonomuraea recticatena]|uniref:hypothetical protein n=1 Tax=Nonomuraea recticatena TaxID=46178 RepID=UPI003621457C
MAAAPDGASFQQFVDMAQQKYGLTLPADLATLLGKNLTVALDGDGLATMGQSGQLPKVGVRIVTDPAKAQEVIGKIEKAFTDAGQPAPQIAKVPGDGTLTLATTPEYAKQLSEGARSATARPSRRPSPTPQAPPSRSSSTWTSWSRST